jgi:hypothetical protein
MQPEAMQRELVTKVCELLYPTDHLTSISSQNEAQPETEKEKVRLAATQMQPDGYTHPAAF